MNWKGMLFFFVSVLSSHAFSQEYNFRNFTSSDGLAQSYVYSIMQDERGYLWVGTGEGLSRYNGFIFENYTTSDSLAENFVSCGITDEESMWFGHMNGGLSYHNGKEFKVVPIPVSNSGPVTHFAKSPDDRIWVSNYGGSILELEKSKGVIKQYLFNGSESIISFDFLDNGELLVGTHAGLLHCRLKETGEIEIIGPVAEIPESKVSQIIKMRDKTGFYVATENDGIYLLTYENNLFKISTLAPDTEFDFTGIQCIFEDSRSDLWLGSFGNGLIKMDLPDSMELTKITVFNKAGGFTTDNIKTICEDGEGNIWSGNYGEGLTQIMAKIYAVYAFDNALYGNEVFSIYSDMKYRWIGTENGLLKLDQKTGKIIRFYGKGSGLPKDIVTAIYTADGKELWLGTEANGVFRMDTEREKISRFPMGSGELENSITVITGNNEKIWIGTKKGLCSIQSGTNGIKWYSISQGGLPHNFINCLYTDRTGRLWISSHSNMLAYIWGEKVFKLPINSGSGILTFGPITEDADSRIWAGSNGNGVFRIASDSVINITTKEGLLSDFCYSIICDDSSHIWVGHKGGLSKIRTTDLFVKPIQHFENITDNYRFNPNAIHKDQQGIIWFGSGEGLVSYDPAKEIFHPRPPVPIITSFKINDEERDYSNIIMLNPGKYKIRIDFLAVNLTEPALVTYQFKLDGYDQAYEMTKNTSVTYGHLTEGEYTFILNASSGDGIVSENPLIININIKMPVWKKWWFFPLIVLLLIILLFSYMKRREYTFRVEKRILEEKVKERTHEIQHQKDEIELQRDMIDNKNAEITSSIRYARNIQQAILPSPDLMDKLLPENFIFLKPKDIVSGDFYWLSEKGGKIIFTVADCTGHGVPGAFMSLLSVTMLNEIINIQGITRPDKIINRLHGMIDQALRNNKMDGLDIALCAWDKQKEKIQYTGAMNNLVQIRNGKLEEVKADHFSVNSIREDFSPFTLKEIDLKKGDILYLFTDGFKDQFGGVQDEKYSTRRFYKTLLEIHKMPMMNQKAVLEEKLSAWMQDTFQTDDITVMGIRL